MKKMNNKGFSLVELIIVIAIMAVLIGVLAPQFIKYVERSRESTDLQNAEEVKTALEAYVADKGEDMSGTIKLTFSSTGLTSDPANIATDADKLPSYGVDASKGQKSKKWTGDYTWTYDLSTYKWTDGGATATYFKMDGTPTS